ncbi:MAG: hypothetical protein Q4G03_08470 [Planctomycetia bacterium]|nr:hypothetical protein [Planctomycetia bacterium]
MSVGAWGGKKLSRERLIWDETPFLEVYALPRFIYFYDERLVGSSLKGGLDFCNNVKLGREFIFERLTEKKLEKFPKKRLDF